jgi:hypothetical protein
LAFKSRTVYCYLYLLSLDGCCKSYSRNTVTSETASIAEIIAIAATASAATSPAAKAATAPPAMVATTSTAETASEKGRFQPTETREQYCELKKMLVYNVKAVF